MATLKSGTTVGGSPVLSAATHNNTGNPHSQYKLITDLVAEYYTKTTIDSLLALKVDVSVLPDIEADKLAAEAAAAAAAISETNAAASATSAASSASQAATSATNAATSASEAATSEANAATSETNAAASASAAATSASNASASATSAASSASSASTSATNAATSETNAAASAASAAASYDSFDDRYLGAKVSAPTLDNDGNPLITGALYFNSTEGKMKVWTGSAWEDAYVPVSGFLQDSDIGVTVQAYDANTAKTNVPQFFTSFQTFKEVADTVYSLTGTSIDPINGSIQYKTLSSNTTFTENLTTGQCVLLRLSGGATYTVTWPTMTWITSAGNTAPTLTASDVVILWKEGSTLYGAYVGSGV